MLSLSRYAVLDKQTPFSYVVWGMLIHVMAYVLVQATQLTMIYAGICVVGWYYILMGFYLERRELFMQLHGKYLMMLMAYIGLCIVMIARGYMIDYPYPWFSNEGMINYHFFAPHYILPYLMPFILLWPVEHYDFRCLVRASVVVSILVILVFVVFYDEILESSLKQSIGQLNKSYEAQSENFQPLGELYFNVAIIVLCRKYVTSKVWLINTAGLVVSLLINLMAARRGNSAIYGALVLFNIYFYIRSLSYRARVFATIATALVVGSAVYVSMSFSGFNYIRKRATIDNRSQVDEALMSQMTEEEEWFGKGLNGRYYFNLYLYNDRYDGWRYLSETGYYNMILKGGYVMTWLYILLLLYPAYVGFFKSRNLLCKAFSFIIFLSLLELYPFGHLLFNLKFMIIWMGLAFNTNSYVREMDDEEIYQYYFEPYDD